MYRFHLFKAMGVLELNHFAIETTLPESSVVVTFFSYFLFIVS